MIDAAIKEAATATIEHWHEHFMPLHFNEQSYERYGYQLRKGQDEPNLVYSDGGRAVRMGKHGRLINNPKYFWAKWRRMKTKDALVYTGESKRRAEQSIKLSSQKRGDGSIRASGVLDLPRYFYQQNKSVGAPDKVDELLRTTRAEDQELGAFYERAVSRALSSASAPSSSTLRIA